MCWELDTEMIRFTFPFKYTVDGGWSAFNFGECSVTCGRGYLIATRKCNNPSPAHEGRNCVGPRSERRTCNEGCCPGT